ARERIAHRRDVGDESFGTARRRRPPEKVGLPAGSGDERAAAATTRAERSLEQQLLEEVLRAVGVPHRLGLTRRSLAQVQRRAAHGNDRAVRRRYIGLLD